MALYAIADLHLPLGINKPMDIFGYKWENYVSKLETNWKESIKDNDCVIIAGDISWGTYLEQSIEDFKFIHSLPGKKIILKGNHDYWWTTQNKLKEFIAQNNFDSINFLYNNSFKHDDIVVCGTRGWKCIEDKDFNSEDIKMYRREIGRLELSLKSINFSEYKHLVVALHFPPISATKLHSEFVEIMKNYNASMCIYGHLHDASHKYAINTIHDGIKYNLVSADFLEFKPLKISDII